MRDVHAAWAESAPPGATWVNTIAPSGTSPWDESSASEASPTSKTDPKATAVRRRMGPSYGSSIVRTWRAATFSSTCTVPEGHTTSMRSTTSASPSPKCIRGSLCDR